MFEIRLAKTQRELNSIYHFRYNIYIEEMQRVQHDADHINRTIIDVMDDDCFNLIALKDSEIVGTARINFGLSISDYYRNFYKILEQPGVTLEEASVITRMMFKKEYRNSIYVYKMFLACYEFGLRNGIRFNFIDCDNKSVSMYESVGCKKYQGFVKHKEHAESNPMIIDLHDEALFREIKSPFLKPLLEWQDSQVLVVLPRFS